MLRLSKLSDYATVIMARLARDPGRHFSAAEIAGTVGIAAPTVSKLLKTLTRAGLLLSQQGSRGGYALARAPEEISLAQVIDAVEGPLGIVECGVEQGLCAYELGCQVRVNWQRVNRVIRDALEGIKLGEFAQPAFQPVDLQTIRSRQADHCAASDVGRAGGG